jgi:pSer/pThr/pTyr-binding forkhead associated (FHA) protein
MSPITLRVLDGADRGRVFDGLAPPVTIGREEGNTIQLNDERVSRFHVKIQEDHDQLVLTDLESTNGTKVNGEDINLRILRFGDMIALGRSVLLFGSRDQIALRLANIRSRDGDGTLNPRELQLAAQASALDFELNVNDDADLQATLHSLEPPPLPDRLSPGQAAQFAEILEYLHIRLRNLLKSVEVSGKPERIEIDVCKWQTLVDIQSRLAEYLRRIGDPEGD